MRLQARRGFGTNDPTRPELAEGQPLAREADAV
jgi:hypothetical protein